MGSRRLCRPSCQLQCRRVIARIQPASSLACFEQLLTASNKCDTAVDQELLCGDDTVICCEHSVNCTRQCKSENRGFAAVCAIGCILAETIAVV